MHAFSGIVNRPLGGRQEKPRRVGLTAVMDKGLGPAATADLAVVAGGYIDLWKIAFGTAALYPEEALQAKLEILQTTGIAAYPGGTFLEIALLQGRARQFLERIGELGFQVAEVSDGTVSMTRAQRLELIGIARDLGLRVITEVGKKDPQEQPATDALIELAQCDLEAGAEYVVVEARESGRGIGIYDAQGKVRTSELEALAGALPVERLIWEAPEKGQQQALILRFGSNVSLGNVPPAETLALEALRQGLRGDTLRLAAHRSAERPAAET